VRPPSQRPLQRQIDQRLNGYVGRESADDVDGTELLDAEVEELIRYYTSVPSARASASSTSTPR
jgi:cytochrome P450